MSPGDKTQARLYDAIHQFNETACWPALRHAQNRQYLAEHLANALVPSWLHERKAETAGEEIAHVLLMVGLMPSDWLDAYRDEVLAEVTKWLVKKAREYRASRYKRDQKQGDTVAVLASKISRGAVRPDNLRMLPDPGFFETDRTYQRTGNLPGDGPWTFKVAAIATDPRGNGVAFGFLSHDDALWIGHAEGAESWAKDGWTDITEGGEGQ